MQQFEYGISKELELRK